MSRWGRICALLCLSLGGLTSRVVAEFPDQFNHPEIRWLETESDHFVFVFTPALEETARLAADILEAAHGPMCDYLGITPRAKTTVILADFDDVGVNNFARRMEHVIYLSNPVMNQAKVAREQWLEHLLKHEYVHVLNGWALRQGGRTLGHWIEWSGMDLQPQWLTEGLAEYMGSDLSREQPQFALQAARQEQLLAGAQLDIPDTRFDVIQTSVVYKQGQSMCLRLVDLYGEDVFRRLFEQYGRTPQFDIAFRIVTGDTLEEFERGWRRWIADQAAGLPAEDPALTGTTGLTSPLEATLGARLSPDGRRLAVYGVAKWEEPLPGLWVTDPQGARWRKIAGNLDLFESWKLTWSADSNTVVYAGRRKNDRGGVVNAIYAYNCESNKGWRVNTGKMRVFEPALSPDGQRLAFVHYTDARAIICTMAASGGDVQPVTAALPHDCFSPSWSPDGRQLVFSVATPEGTDLAVIGVDGSGYRKLTNDPWPDQSPDWSPDGRTIAFVSYRQPGRVAEAAVSAEAEGLAGAATNLYTVPVAGGAPVQLTRATSGGVYSPTWTPDGKALYFSLFQVRNAHVRRLELTPTVATTELPETPETPVAVALSEPEPAAAASVALTVPAADPAPAILPTELTTPAAAPAKPLVVLAPVQDYRAFRQVQPYILRPFNGDDGLGDTWGVRLRATDPLQKHDFMAEVAYGAGASDQWSYQFQYLNDQTDATFGVNVFRRVPPPRGERGALVAETSTGVELLAEVPLALSGNPFIQDKLRFGYEYAEHEPFATLGGVLRPAPVGARIAGPSVGFKRVQLLPGYGNQEFSTKFTRADLAFGSQLEYFTWDTLWIGQFFAPNPRSTVTFAAQYNWFDGQDFTRTQVNQHILAGEVRWDWRLVDQVWGRHTWPYLHIGPVNLVGSYQLRELVNGTSGGADLRDRARVQATNTGYLSRHATYELKAGPTFYVGGDRRTDWTATLRFDFRDLPF